MSALLHQSAMQHFFQKCRYLADILRLRKTNSTHRRTSFRYLKPVFGNGMTDEEWKIALKSRSFLNTCTSLHIENFTQKYIKKRYQTSYYDFLLHYFSYQFVFHNWYYYVMCIIFSKMPLALYAAQMEEVKFYYYNFMSSFPHLCISDYDYLFQLC